MDKYNTLFFGLTVRMLVQCSAKVAPSSVQQVTIDQKSVPWHAVRRPILVILAVARRSVL